jgi:hypothetical protein
LLKHSRIHVRLVVSAAIVTCMFLIGTAGAQSPDGFLTTKPAYITLDPGLPSGASVKPIISVGEIVDGVKFEGIPDGIGVRPGADRRTVDVYVNHEQSTVPFDPDGPTGPRPFEADFQDSSVTKLTLTTRGGSNQGAVLAASVAIGPENGFLRFCSASMAGPREGLSSYVFFTGEETNDVVSGVQHGFAVVLDTDSGNFTAVPGLGRLNHENTVVVPGRWEGLAMLTTDDTFTAPSSQLYMYRADNQSDLFADNGTLYALRITHANGRRVNATDPFNGANDYLDLSVGEKFKGEFIPVPPEIARGDQTELENWSNDNNVFQSIRLEDLAYDPDNPDVVYIADTGATRIVPDDTTGRMRRGPTGTIGQADNGRIFRLVLEEDDPTEVESLTVLADGDAVGTPAFVPFRAPDNVDFSEKSFMVQEDIANAKIWQYRLNQKTWRVVATVNDPGGESSGIVDASKWFGDGTWLLDVQAHSTFIDQAGTNPLSKREDGQLMLLKVPGS